MPRRTSQFILRAFLNKLDLHRYNSDWRFLNGSAYHKTLLLKGEQEMIPLSVSRLVVAWVDVPSLKSRVFQTTMQQKHTRSNHAGAVCAALVLGPGTASSARNFQISFQAHFPWIQPKFSQQASSVSGEKGNKSFCINLAR